MTTAEAKIHTAQEDLLRRGFSVLAARNNFFVQNARTQRIRNTIPREATFPTCTVKRKPTAPWKQK